jgi:hypothetical protein
MAGFLFKLETVEGAPTEPPTLSSAVPNWRPGDEIPLGRNRSLRVVGVRGPFDFGAACARLCPDHLREHVEPLRIRGSDGAGAFVEPAGNRSDGRKRTEAASGEEPAGLPAALQAGERTRRLYPR